MGQTGIAKPVHMVTLSAFSMSAYEITQGQYKAVIGSNPSTSRPAGSAISGSAWFAVPERYLSKQILHIPRDYHIFYFYTPFSKGGLP